MKSRAHKNPPASYDDELHVEDGSNEEVPDVRVNLPQPVRTASGFDAGLLMAGGIAVFTGGMALCLGPRMSWKVSQIAEGFKHLGVEGGVLVVGGLLLTAMGLLRRGQIALRTPTTEQAEDRLLIEQLTKDSLRAADDRTRLESGLAHVEAEMVNTRRELGELIANALRETIAAIPQPNDAPSPDEAIFRLAASLDQVGMRIEQRLKAQYTALQDHLEDVGAAILSARNHLQGLGGEGEQSAGDLRVQVRARVETALEETGYWANREMKTPSLGVLDTIEDSAVEPRPELEEIESALPMNPEEAREHGAASPFDMNVRDLDTQTRLIQLSSLLADPKLRQALKGFQGQNEV